MCLAPKFRTLTRCTNCGRHRLFVQQQDSRQNMHFKRDNISIFKKKKWKKKTLYITLQRSSRSHRRIFHLWLDSHTMWCFYTKEECRPNPETWFMELKLHFFVVSAREREREMGKRKNGVHFYKLNSVGKMKAFFVWPLCEMCLFLLSLHWYLPDNYDCIKPLYWFIIDLHICIMTWGVLVGLNPRSLPQVGIEVFHVCPELQRTLADLLTLLFMLLLRWQRSVWLYRAFLHPVASSKVPEFILVVWLIALHKTFPSYSVKIGLFFSINFPK